MGESQGQNTAMKTTYVETQSQDLMASVAPSRDTDNKCSWEDSDNSIGDQPETT